MKNMKRGLRIYEKALRRKNRVLHEAMFEYPKQGRYSQSGAKYILFPFHLWQQDRNGNWYFFLDDLFRLGIWGDQLGSNRHNHEEIGMRLLLSDLISFDAVKKVAEKYRIETVKLGWAWFESYYDKDQEYHNRVDKAIFELTGVSAKDLAYIEGGRADEVGYKGYEYPTPKK